MDHTLDRLDADPVLETAQNLTARIERQLGGHRGLTRVARELETLIDAVRESTEDATVRQRWIQPAAKAGIALVLAVTAVVLVLAFRSAVMDAPDTGLDWLPLLESLVNDLVFAGLAIWFLYSVPERVERDGILDQLHRLRSLAHIVDMHQLSKDVDQIRRTTAAPPEVVTDTLTLVQFENYLDYCSELLSLISKAAALCAEKSRDSVVLDTVSTIENLTVSLERKIWQKIVLLDSSRRGGPTG